MQVTKFNLVTDLQFMLSNVPYSSFLFECNTERGCIDQLYIELGGFQFLLILDLWGISLHAVVVFGLGKNILFKSVLGH